MSDKPRYAHQDAMRVAKEILAQLIPWCVRIEIVGSLRRKKPTVGDIELLFVSKTGTRKVDFFTTEEYAVCWAEVERLVAVGTLARRRNKLGQTTWGNENRLAVHVPTGIPVDLFATNQINWWNSLVVRTGGKDNNLMLTTTAQKRGWTFNAYGSGYTHLRTGEHHRTTSEADVFEFLGLRCLAPEQRK
jgi:DNA polymerase/3'-5' exonuclease PolX